MLIIAGPCALLPDKDRMTKLATDLKEAGADVFRAGVWKGGVFPPKDPKVWGPGAAGVAPLRATGFAAGLSVATEVRTPKHLDELARMPGAASGGYAALGMVWTGARIMQAYDDVREIAAAAARMDIPFAIKRHPGSTLRDLLGIIAHVIDSGYPEERLWVIERGTVSITYHDEVRWRPDPLAIAQVKETYPDVRVMGDASHSVGRREYVFRMAMAYVAAGADGLMIEVMDRPEDSPSDVRQCISVSEFAQIAHLARQVETLTAKGEK